MIVISVLMAAISPGLALLSYFYLKDRYHSEPISMVARVFLFGALLVFPILVLQRAFVLGIGEDPFVFSFIISSGIEETLKWLIIYLVIYKHVLFDEPYDGIVYAVALSLGFATLENIIYAFLYSANFSSLIYRALLPVSGHALFGVTMGYHLGKAKFSKLGERKHLLFALLLPVLYHGVFDYILLVVETGWVVFMLPLMLYLWTRSLRNVRKANERSPLHAISRR